MTAGTKRATISSLRGIQLGAGFSDIPRASPHATGNMWHARCDYVSTLVSPADFDRSLNSVPRIPGCLHWMMGVDRASQEHWVTSHPSLVVYDVLPYSARDNSSIQYLWCSRAPPSPTPPCHPLPEPPLPTHTRCIMNTTGPQYSFLQSRTYTSATETPRLARRSIFNVPNPDSWDPDPQAFPRQGLTTDRFLLPYYRVNLGCSRVSFRILQYQRAFPGALAAGMLPSDSYHCSWPAHAVAALNASSGFEQASAFAEDAAVYAECHQPMS